MVKRYSLFGLLIGALLLSACGSLATPVPLVTEAPVTEVAQLEPTEADVVEPTEAPPTETPIPVSPTPTEEPTEEPTLVPTEPQDQISLLVSISGNVENGETLFNTFYDEVGFACMTCHLPNSEEMLIGPGLLNVGQRSVTRIEGQSAAEYIYNSIIHPNDYIVETYPENLMPQTYRDLFSDQQLFDLVAYLLTLEGEATGGTDAGAADTNSVEVVFPDFTTPGDAARGEELFNTFQADAGFACMTCHLPDSEDMLIGPGLLNVFTRAETRVDGQTAEEYIYTSIVSPSTYVVDGFTDGLMPGNWAEIYNDESILDIMAYLQTLE